MKLKKTLAGALTLCLAMGAAGAMAEDTTSANTMSGSNTTATTEVKLVIDRTLDSYTITIPSNVEIDPKTKEGTGTITLSDKDLDLVSCTGLNVIIKDAKNEHVKKTSNTEPHFTLKSDSTTDIGWYYIRKPSGNNLSVGDKVLEYSKSKNLTQPQTETLIYYVNSLPTEGTYTDTLTFEVNFTGY